MTSADYRHSRHAGRQRAVVAALAGLGMLLSACGNDFAHETTEAEFPSGCASGRLGCVTERNIAAVAAKPSDLVRPRREQPRDAARREAVMSAYRQGGGARAHGTGSAIGTTLQEGSR
jgi:hypothetical protein